VARLSAHRRALQDYIHSLDDPARSRCSTVLAEYDAQFERVAEEMAQMPARVRAVEALEATRRCS
jgi:hypothetical protein